MNKTLTNIKIPLSIACKLVIVGLTSCSITTPMPSSNDKTIVTLTSTLPPPIILTLTPSPPSLPATIPPTLAIPTLAPLTTAINPTPGLLKLNLMSPPARASFTGNDNPTFSWASTGSLGTFDYYQFQIQHSQGFDVICTKNTSSQARSYVPALNPSQWTVNVVRLSSAVSNGSACNGSVIATSEVRGLSWSNRPSGVASPAANPPTAAPAPSQPTPTPCVPGPSNKC